MSLCNPMMYESTACHGTKQFRLPTRFLSPTLRNEVCILSLDLAISIIRFSNIKVLRIIYI